MGIFHSLCSYLLLKFLKVIPAIRSVVILQVSQYVLELFFDVKPPKLKEWLAKPSTQQMFKEHNFVPKRYSFEPLSI